MSAAPSMPPSSPTQPVITHAEAIAKHSGLVHYCVKRYVRGPTEDALQEGFLGLLRAADTWRPDGGASFSSYAVMFIRGRLFRAHERRRRSGLKGAWDGGSRLLDNVTISMDAPVGENETTLHDLIGVAPDQELGWERVRLNAAVKGLTQKQRDVLEMVCEGLSSSEIGAKLGCSRQRVEQIVEKVIQELRLGAKGMSRVEHEEEPKKPKRVLRMFEYEGRSQDLASWAREKGMPVELLWRRVVAGWTFADVLNKPVMISKQRRRTNG